MSSCCFYDGSLSTCAGLRALGLVVALWNHDFLDFLARFQEASVLSWTSEGQFPVATQSYFLQLQLTVRKGLMSRALCHLNSVTVFGKACSLSRT